MTRQEVKNWVENNLCSEKYYIGQIRFNAQLEHFIYSFKIFNRLNNKPMVIKVITTKKQNKLIGL